MITAEQTIDEQERFRAGDTRILARYLTRVENHAAGMEEVLADLYRHTGQAWRVGFTGPPGAGKSTLVNQATLRYRRSELSVGVVAFDPTSPFTGGALLGDRIRMEKLTLDPGVFIRSMATRGQLGGLAVAVDEACDLMDAFGKDRVLIETVGVGQSELEVAHSADTTVVVLVPQSGDSIQAMKAGLMEIADIFVLNKSDRDGADRAYRELTSIVQMKHSPEGWMPPVLKTTAEKGEGVDELLETIQTHRRHLTETGLLETRRKSRIASKVQRLVEDAIRKDLWRSDRDTRRRDDLDHTRSPYDLAKDLVNDFYREISDERR
ncbi:methylmalonyl Co-A mutase-associated GTPase MeaB [bacterium]|nr:methylmalonyl Co-A mutase-associated GTPase MeaB [bacterium]